MSAGGDKCLKISFPKSGNKARLVKKRYCQINRLWARMNTRTHTYKRHLSMDRINDVLVSPTRR
jgi:hypothetical protein